MAVTTVHLTGSVDRVSVDVREQEGAFFAVFRDAQLTEVTVSDRDPERLMRLFYDAAHGVAKASAQRMLERGEAAS